MCYRLLLTRRVTYHELENVMSLDDVDLLCMAVDAWEDARAVTQKKT